MLHSALNYNVIVILHIIFFFFFFAVSRTRILHINFFVAIDQYTKNFAITFFFFWLLHPIHTTKEIEALKNFNVG